MFREGKRKDSRLWNPLEEFPSPRRQGSTGLRLGRGFETSLLRNSTDSVAEKTIGGDSIGNDRSARSFSPQPVQAGMRNIRGFPNIKADVTLRSSGSSFLPSFKNFTILLFYHRSLTCQIYLLLYKGKPLGRSLLQEIRNVENSKGNIYLFAWKIG